MIEDALEAVRMRNNFYRDNYRRALAALLLALILIILEVMVIYWQVTHVPTPKYFATSSDGRITPLYALDQPNLSKGSILQWANQAAVAAYTFDFVNYQAEFQAASKYFTSNGWQQFMDALNSSNNLTAVLAKKLVVSAVATGAPIILQEGILVGRYAWKIQMPILVTYQSASTQVQQSLLVTMLVTRVPTLNDPQGIGIEQFVAQAS